MTIANNVIVKKVERHFTGGFTATINTANLSKTDFFPAYSLDCNGDVNTGYLVNWANENKILQRGTVMSIAATKLAEQISLLLHQAPILKTRPNI